MGLHIMYFGIWVYTLGYLGLHIMHYHYGIWVYTLGYLGIIFGEQWIIVQKLQLLVFRNSVSGGVRM